MPTVHPITSVEYRLVPDFPYYRVGDDGSAWSRYTPGMHGEIGDTWHKLKASREQGRYTFIKLKNPAAPGYCQRYVHRLVLEAFIGPCPEGSEACHYDGNKSNNVLTNLRWDTRQGNMADMIRHGSRTWDKGSDHPKAKLTEADIPEIRRLVRSGLSMAKTAQRFKVSSASISQVMAGKSWSHVPG